MREEICQAHMAGQMDAGCKEPSWSNAHAYFSTVEEKFNSAAQSGPTNSDYTAALRNEIYRWFSKQQFTYTKLMANQLAERLNSVVKAPTPNTQNTPLLTEKPKPRHGASLFEGLGVNRFNG